MPTLVYVLLYGGVKAESFERLKSFSWSLFTYVAWGTAGLAILLHLRAQWWRITVLAVLESTGAALCGNVEASFAILSACMFPSIPQCPGIRWNVICALPPAAICSANVVHNFFFSGGLCKLLDSRSRVRDWCGPPWVLKTFPGVSATFCNATLIATTSARYIDLVELAGASTKCSSWLWLSMMSAPAHPSRHPLNTDASVYISITAGPSLLTVSSTTSWSNSVESSLCTCWLGSGLKTAFETAFHSAMGHTTLNPSLGSDVKLVPWMVSRAVVLQLPLFSRFEAS